MESSQRLMCTPAPQSSSLNTTLRARKRSKTSSAAGDSLAVNRELRKRGSNSNSECKARHTKCKMRLLSNNLKMSGKHSKTKRASKPKLEPSLQNAVILAPFYTLKKSFQDKLVNFCSFEKLKKMSHKTKMAKKRNMSFEYDIIELKPQTLNIKKEEKMNCKRNEKSKCTGYCRFMKNKVKTGKKQCGSNAKLKRKTVGKQILGSDFPGQLPSKRKKPNGEIFTPSTLKTEFGHRQSFFIPNGQSLLPERCPSSPAWSFQSERDSWETFSNSPSSKEEFLEGALAISSSSFDYLEGFDKNGWDFRDLGKRCNRPGKGTNTPKLLNADLLKKPFKGPSKHLVFERKSSDGQILDFMDREPRSRVISSEESHQHLLPLRMQSRTKTKKQESESGCACPPDSQSSNGGRPSRDTGRASGQTERLELKSLSEDNNSKVSQVEVGVQVEGKAMEEELFINLIKNSQEVSAADACDKNVNRLREKAPEEPHSASGSSFSLLRVGSSSKKSLSSNVETNPVENNPNETKFQLPTEAEENLNQESPN